MPQLLFRKRGMDRRCLYDGILGRCVAAISWPSVWVADYMDVAWLFWAVSTAQMMAWAGKKQRAYKKEFGKEYPRQRKAMIPFLF